MRVLVTRPEPDAEALAKVLEQRGHTVLRAPMLSMVPLPGPAPDWEGVQALLLTSRHAVPGLVSRAAPLGLPVLAVGDATAAAAVAAGYGCVESAAGAARDLAALVRRRLDPAAGELVHLCGRARAADFAALLGPAGFRVRALAVYDARPAVALPETARRALETDALDAVIFFSPRTVASFATLVAEAGLEKTCRSLTAICLSRAVANAADATGWGSTVVAVRPDQSALFEAVDTVAATIDRG